MASNQAERIVPDRNAALTAESVFPAERFETAHHGIATDPHDEREDTKKK